jgi:long-chain acyl-CoA synthetase
MSLTESKTVAALVVDRIAATPDAEAFSTPAGGGQWKSSTWREAGDRIRAIAGGLRALGLADEQRVAILSGTRLEWILADLAILCAGGAATTIYPSNTPEECSYILRDSESAFVFAENGSQLAKLEAERGKLPALKKVILFEGESQGKTDWVMTLAELTERGRKYDAEDATRFEKTARAVRADSLATLVYTSGTTGEPKGVELTHDCWVYEAEAIDRLELLHPDDKQLLWLPLSHVFGKVLEAAQLRIGFSTAVDGRVDKLVENLAQVKPTFVAAVPRIFEKVRNKVVVGIEEGGGLKRTIFEWALGVGRAASEARQKGGSPSAWLKLKLAIADQLVFAKLKARFGGRMRYFISGSAPLAREVAEFFDAAGLPILEGYGLTESSAASLVNRPHKYRLGTVGLPLPGTEVRCAPEDGEVLLRGRGIMRGYKGRAEASREALDDGWLRTGDIGEIDADGFLRITDRKKDLIKTSNGKYVAPQALEGQLKALCPYVSQVLIHGNNRNFVTALVTLDVESMRGWARDNGLDGKSPVELVADPKVRALVQGFIDQLNGKLANYAAVKKFVLLANDFSLEAGELTASLKMKRKVIEQHYRAELDGLYGGARA